LEVLSHQCLVTALNIDFVKTEGWLRRDALCRQAPLIRQTGDDPFRRFSSYCTPHRKACGGLPPLASFAALVRRHEMKPERLTLAA